MRMIIDCDPGHDDAIALILAHRHAEVVGITAVAGNAPLAATQANALAVTAVLGVDTPVYAGADTSLLGVARDARIVHGESGLGGVSLPSHDRALAAGHAVDFLLEASDSETWIVAIGPLTNIALAIARDPSWPRRIAGISIMGGSADNGNVTATAEFNIHADPEAAARVFRCGAPLIMSGLNLTHQLPVDDAVLTRVRQIDTAAGRLASESFAFLLDRLESLTGSRRASLHDPCAVLAVTHPHLVETLPCAVAVELAGEHTRGMTVVDRRSRSGVEPNVDVGLRLASEEAMALVEDALAQT